MTKTIAELLVKLGVSVDGAKKAEKDLTEVGTSGKKSGKEVEKGAKKGEKGIKKLAESAKKAGEAIKSAAASAGKALGGVGIALAAAGAAAGAVFATVDKITAGVDAQSKLATATGVTYQEFQKLEFAATQSGASAQDLSVGILKLRKGLEEVAVKGTGPAADAFNELGLSVRMIKGLDAEQQLGMIGDALNQVESKADRARLSAQLLGEGAGPKLASLLAEGSAGIQKMTADASVLSDEQQKNATAFQDSVGEIKNVLSAVMVDVIDPLVPIMTDIIGQFKEWFKANREVIKSKIDEFLKGLVARVKAFSVVLKQLSDLLSVVFSLIQKLTGAFGSGEKSIERYTSALKIALIPIRLLTGAIGLLVDAISFMGSAFSSAEDDAESFIATSLRAAGSVPGAKKPGDVRDDLMDPMTGRDLSSNMTGVIVPTVDRRDLIIGDLSRKAKAKMLTKAEADELIRLAGPRAEEFALAGIKKDVKKKRGGAKAKTKADALQTSDLTLSEALATLRSGVDNPQALRKAVEAFARKTPSTKSIRPTVAIDFFNFVITQTINSRDPVEAGKQSAKMIKQEFVRATAKAAQNLNGNVVR